MPKKLLLIIAALVAAFGIGVLVAYLVVVRGRPEGKLDTVLAGVSVVTAPPDTQPATTAPQTQTTTSAEPAEGPCWNEFGGDPQRTLARPTIQLGKPAEHALWARGVGSYMEYAPSFCDGTLYVNTNRGLTLALAAETGRVLWKRQGGVHASTPAIAGPRLIVSSHDGTVTALDRATGKPVWQLRTDAKVESSPVAIGDTVYFGATDGRLFALDVASGRVRWAYDTGGRINASPSVWGSRICITTYAGSIFCLNRLNGEKLWDTYVKRDAFRYESFYASPSTDGQRLYTVSRDGKVVALDARTGRVVWTQSVDSWGYSTPAISEGRVFVGGFDHKLRAFRSTDGHLLWARDVGGYIIGPALVVGRLVFVSTPQQNKTFALRVADGKIVWSFPAGKYAPGIATDRRYYLSLNGLLVAFPGTGRS